MSLDPDPALEDDWTRILRRRAPAVTGGGAWASVVVRAARLRRRRRSLQTAGVVLVVVVAVSGGLWVRSLPPLDDRTGVTTATVSYPSAVTLPPVTEKPVATLVSDPAADPRVKVLYEWMVALQSGDVGKSWTLMSPRAQSEVGGRDVYAAELDALGLRWGMWASSADVAYQVVDLGLVAGERLAAVTVYGQWTSPSYSVLRADTILVVSGSKTATESSGSVGAASASLVDPYRLLVADDPSESGLVDTHRVPVFEAGTPKAGGIQFEVPHAQAPSAELSGPLRPAPGKAVLAFDDSTVWGEGISATDGLGLHRTAPVVHTLVEGTHVATVVFMADDGGLSAAAIVDLVIKIGPPEAGGSPTVSSPAPPVSESTMQAAHVVVSELLRSVLTSDRVAFVALYAPTHGGSAERLFAQERARLAELGPDAYYMREAQFNWFGSGRWALTWPSTEPDSGLTAWVAADPQARLLVALTTMDGVTRYLPLNVDGSVVTIQPLGVDPETQALGGFDPLGRPQ